MRRETRRVHVFKSHSLEFNMDAKVYYTKASDFGYESVLLQCQYCDEYYWYEFDAEHYIRPFYKQIENKHCENCGAALSSCLVPPHKNVDCGGYKISLDDNFAGNTIPNDSAMESIEVYLLYSE